MVHPNPSISVVIPAKNEAASIGNVVSGLKRTYPNFEIIVVNDGSSDDTSEIAKKQGAHVIDHPYSIGNGAAIKSGARAANNDYIIFMDADGQHSPEDLGLLLAKLDLGFDMIVGARNKSSQASLLRSFANSTYNYLASKITGHRIPDLTSGFRLVRRDIFIRFLYLLPNGFSYPTTITMAFFRSGFSVAYVPIEAKKRIGKSHINIFTDGIRFLVIIIKIASLYSPLKVFTPVAITTSVLGLTNYAITYFSDGRFTNMSALLIIISIIIFMMGLLAEQITVLTYAASERRKQD